MPHTGFRFQASAVNRGDQFSACWMLHVVVTVESDSATLEPDVEEYGPYPTRAAALASAHELHARLEKAFEAKLRESGGWVGSPLRIDRKRQGQG